LSRNERGRFGALKSDLYEINNTFIGTADQCAASSTKQRKELKDQYFE
jgi:hypothetical protein